MAQFLWNIFSLKKHQIKKSASLNMLVHKNQFVKVLNKKVELIIALTKWEKLTFKVDYYLEI